MFGLGLFKAYGSYIIEPLGGMSAAVLMVLFTRILVGIGWYFMFKKAGERPIYAFVPMVGSYLAFRLVWDDFSFAFLFSATTFIACINALGVDHSVVNACAVANFIMWWFMSLLTARAFGVSMIFGFLMGGIPWFGTILLGLLPSAEYKGPWSTDPQAEQNLSSKERKKIRRKAEKAAKKK